MQQGSTGSSTGSQNLTPQPTGFSQVHSRPGNEIGVGGMSVLLSWHEKVRLFSLLFALALTHLLEAMH
jgi:actin related protein 2/3 complex subunit 5